MQQSVNWRRLLVGIVTIVTLVGGTVSGWRVAAQDATLAPQPADPPVIVAEGTASLGSAELAWQVTRQETHTLPLQTPEPEVPVGFVVADTAAVTLSDHADGSDPELVPAGDAGFTPAGFRQVRSDGPSPAFYVTMVLVPAPADPVAGGTDPNLVLLSEGFPVPAGASRLQLWAGRLAPPASWSLPPSEAPVALLVTSGAVEIQTAGAPEPLTLVAGEAAALPSGSVVAVRGSAEAVVYAAVILDEARVTPTTAPSNAGPRRTPTPTPTATISPTADMTATVTATTMPTTEPLTPVDTDGDGLTDADEAQRGTNPTQNDSDGDGVFDGYEVSVGLNPLSPDSDGDGVTDYDELNTDTGEPGSGDADGDGLTDGYEEQVSGTNPTARDTDGDGLSDGFEIDQGSNPNAIDSDADGVDDGYETGRGMNPLATDSDNDALADGEELSTYGTNPLNPDSDGDGREDGYEVQKCGQDPAIYTDYEGVIVC